MFVLNLKFVLGFLMHVVKRSVYGINKLVIHNRDSQFSSELDNSVKESVFHIDQHGLQDYDTEFRLKFGFFKLNGDRKLNGRVTGLQNIKETHNNYYYKQSEICTMAKFEASELSINYNGILKLLNIGPAFLMSTIFKNVKIFIEFKINPFERITFYFDDIIIDALEIDVRVSGLNVFNWVINLIISIILKVMSFMILCFAEFYTKCYFNKNSTDFYLTQHYVLQNVSENMVNYTLTQLKRFRAEIDRKTSQKSKFGPTSYFYNLMTCLFEFNKVFHRIVLAKVFSENFENFSSDAELHSESFESEISISQSSESESGTNFLISGESGFDNSALRQINRITSTESSSETEADSHSTENDYNNKTVSTLSDTSSDDEIVNRPMNDPHDASDLQSEKSPNKNESQLEKHSSNDASIQLEESYYECEAQHENDSCDESSFQFEESCNDIESQSESDFYEKKRYQNYPTGNSSEEEKSEKNCNKEAFTQDDKNCNAQDSTQSENNSNRKGDSQPELNCDVYEDTKPKNVFNAEDDTLAENIEGEDDTLAENIKGEDDTLAENIKGEDDTLAENIKGDDNTLAENIKGDDDTLAESIKGDENYSGNDVNPPEKQIK